MSARPGVSRSGIIDQVVNGDDVQRRTFELLQVGVLEEVVVQNGAGRLGLTEEVLEQLAQQIAVTIDYAFDVQPRTG